MCVCTNGCVQVCDCVCIRGRQKEGGTGRGEREERGRESRAGACALESWGMDEAFQAKEAFTQLLFKQRAGWWLYNTRTGLHGARKKPSFPADDGGGRWSQPPSWSPGVGVGVWEKGLVSGAGSGWGCRRWARGVGVGVGGREDLVEGEGPTEGTLRSAAWGDLMPQSCRGRVDLFNFFLGGGPEEGNQGYGEGSGLSLSPAEGVLPSGGLCLSHSRPYCPLRWPGSVRMSGHLHGILGVKKVSVDRDEDRDVQLPSGPVPALWDLGCSVSL